MMEHTSSGEFLLSQRCGPTVEPHATPLECIPDVSSTDEGDLIRCDQCGWPDIEDFAGGSPNPVMGPMAVSPWRSAKR